jgi:hypothetical protein
LDPALFRAAGHQPFERLAPVPLSVVCFRGADDRGSAGVEDTTLTAVKEFFGEECPRCLTWAGEGVSVCGTCGYDIPLALVFPYDDPPWEYDDDLIALMQEFEALRLLAKYAGRHSGRIAAMGRCRRLYLSRYTGFEFSALRDLRHLEYLELDYAPIDTVDGVQRLDLAVLKLTECRTLQRIDALGDCRNVRFLSLALCNAVLDHTPIGRMKTLQSLFIESRSMDSLDFLRTLPHLHTIALGVDKIVSGGIAPLFELQGLTHVALRKKLVKPKDLHRIRECWPDAEIVVD